MSDIKLIIKKKRKVVVDADENIDSVIEQLEDLSINSDSHSVFVFIHLHYLFNKDAPSKYHDTGFYLTSILFNVDYNLNKGNKRKSCGAVKIGKYVVEHNIDAFVINSECSVKYYNYCKDNNNILFVSTKKYTKYTVKFIYVNNMLKSEFKHIWRTYFNFTKMRDNYSIDSVINNGMNTHIDNKVNIIFGERVLTSIKMKVIYKNIQKNKMILV